VSQRERRRAAALGDAVRDVLGAGVAAGGVDAGPRRRNQAAAQLLNLEETVVAQLEPESLRQLRQSRRRRHRIRQHHHVKILSVTSSRLRIFVNYFE